MQSSARSAGAFEELPDPGRAGSLNDLVEQLQLLKVWAGDPSYEWITGRVNAAWRAAGRPAGESVGKTTVVSCFRPGRRRLALDLVVAVVAALHPDVGYVTQWRQALQMVSGQATAAGQVRVQNVLPPRLAGFTGRTAELGRLRRVLQQNGASGGAAAIAGMAGVGKTQLAIEAGHLLAGEKTIDQVLFVNLRGFHRDPSQPPVEPSAVLDGFLRLLAVPGQQIPHRLPARAAAYRDRLAGTRTLIVLDNAVDADQVRPLLPGTPGCPVLITSRRSLTALDQVTHLAMDVFTPTEARQVLTRAAPRVAVGASPDAVARIADRCGRLPLALSLVAANIRGRPGWTLTDHADRLDERHHHRRLESGVELALELSYQQLPASRQRLLRMMALHPGQDFDAYAVAALAGSDPPTTNTEIHDLVVDHLLQPAASGRYTLHDVIRDFAAGRAGDEDAPSEHRAALTRLFEYYLATAATAMDTLYPGVARDRPTTPGTPTRPPLADPVTARTWLDTERATLVAVAGHAATHDWPTHAIRLSSTLHRYFDSGHHTDGLTVHHHALHAARQVGDPQAQAQAAIKIGAAYFWLGQTGQAIRSYRQALTMFQHLSDPAGQARVVYNLGTAELQSGRYQPAAAQFEQALALCLELGDRHGEAIALNGLGLAEVRLGRYGPAAAHLDRALTLCRELGNRTMQAWTLDSAGTLQTRLDQPARATALHQQALVIFREIGERDGEAFALNGLGEAAHAARQSAAVTHHTAALAIATAIGARHQQAHAHAGLGHAHRMLGKPDNARHHYEQALALYTDLDMPEADQISAHLAAITTDTLARP